jgi:hypothetical protein
VFAFLPHDERWKKLYSEDFSVDEMKTIIGALDQTMWQAGFMAEKALGRADRRQRQSNRVLNTWPGCAAGEKEK